MGSVHEFSDRAAIEQEAREWLIRLDSETPLSRAETDNLHEWIGRSPAHRQELKRISQFWDQANRLTELAIPLERAECRVPGRVQRMGRSLLASRSIAVTAAVVVACVSVALTFWLAGESITSTNGLYATAIGQQRTIHLADDSTLVINTDTQVHVEYGKSLRKIHLLRGEAHFRVARNPDKPFEVLVGAGVVRAVGTAFSVQLRDDERVNVTVAEGRVELVSLRARPASGGRNVVEASPTEVPSIENLGSVKAGEGATFNNALRPVEITQLAAAEVERRLAWREGLLVFNGEPLSAVVAEVNRYTPTKIHIGDPELETLPIGGRFKIDDLEAIFDVLGTSFDIRVVRLNDRRIQLHSARNQ